jgi:hypothetical protein
MNMTIRFGRELYEEYFDVANVEYYDTILGTLFLRKLGVSWTPGLLKPRSGTNWRREHPNWRSILLRRVVERGPMTEGE